MPIMSGQECGRHLKQMQTEGKLQSKLVMISGDTFTRKQYKELKHIFAEVMSKPISKKDFWEMLDKMGI
jgi:CheY-like chemotaxis protein